MRLSGAFALTTLLVGCSSSSREPMPPDAGGATDARIDAAVAMLDAARPDGATPDASSPDAGTQDAAPMPAQEYGTAPWVARVGTGHLRVAALASRPGLGCVVVGWFWDKAVLGASGSPTLTIQASEGPNGYADLFVARFDGEGHAVFASVMTSPGENDLPMSGAVLGDGSTVVTTRFWGTLALAPGTPDERTFTSPLGAGLVVRYRPDGRVAYARTIQGDDSTTVDTVIDAGGDHVIISGVGGAHTDIGGDAAPGYAGLFFAELDGNGDAVWVVRTGSDASASELALLPDGSLLAAGSFLFDAVFGAGEPKETKLEADYIAPYLVRYTPAHHLDWVKAGDGTEGAFHRFALGSGGAVEVSGRFRYSLTLAGAPPITLSEPDALGAFFFAAYDRATGALLRAASPGEGNDAEIVAGARGSLALGEFILTIDLGNGIRLTRQGDNGPDTFVARLDAKGRAVGAVQATHVLSWGRSLAALPDGTALAAVSAIRGARLLFSGAPPLEVSDDYAEDLFLLHLAP